MAGAAAWVLATMTTTQRAGGASPVDFAAFGDYGDFRRKQPQPATGEFVRPAYPFRGRITADGSSGYPAVACRYHLYISWPWPCGRTGPRSCAGCSASRRPSRCQRLTRSSMGRGWAFREGPGHSLDPVNGFSLLREAYQATEPGYDCYIVSPGAVGPGDRPDRQQQLPQTPPSTWTPSSARSPTAPTCTRRPCAPRSTRSTRSPTRP